MLTLITNIKTGPITDKPTTQRLNFPFNSFFELNGECYGLSSTGIYKLGGDLDNTEKINAYCDFPAADLGIVDEKYLRYLFAYGEFEGDMYVTAIADEHTTAKKQEQILNAPDTQGVHQVKVKMGEGDKGTYWKIRMSNVDGSFFSIKRLELLPTTLDHGFKTY